MKLNDIEVVFRQVDTEQVDGVFIIHDSGSKKVIMFNEVSSFVWKMILEYERNGEDIVTEHIVHRISAEYAVSEDGKQEVYQDIERILQEFFNSGLLRIKSL